MSERKEVWYWVKVGNAPWTPSRLSKNGHPMIAERGMTYQIDQRIPSPDEPWQCVPVEPTTAMKQVADIDTPGPMTAWKCWQVMLKAAPSTGEDT